MGTINHNAIIATTWQKDLMDKAKKWIESLNEEECGLFVFNDNVFANSYSTIAMTTDGSKEGWEESNRGDKLRKKFIELLESKKYEDGSSGWSYIEVGYGEYGASIENTNCHDCIGIPEKGDTVMARVNRWKGK